MRCQYYNIVYLWYMLLHLQVTCSFFITHVLQIYVYSSFGQKHHFLWTYLSSSYANIAFTISNVIRTNLYLNYWITYPKFNLKWKKIAQIRGSLLQHWKTLTWPHSKVTTASDDRDNDSLNNTAQRIPYRYSYPKSYRLASRRERKRTFYQTLQRMTRDVVER